jgi:hypothetical protein
MIRQDSRDITGNPMLLSADIDYEGIKYLGLHEERRGLPCFQPGFAEHLQALRLQLTFPLDGTAQRYEAAPDYPLAMEQSVAFFQGYYPIDFGPLPVPGGYERDVSAGVQLALPNDPVLLGKIEGRFLRLDPPQE